MPRNPVLSSLVFASALCAVSATAGRAHAASIDVDAQGTADGVVLSLTALGEGDVAPGYNLVIAFDAGVGSVMGTSTPPGDFERSASENTCIPGRCWGPHATAPPGTPLPDHRSVFTISDVAPGEIISVDFSDLSWGDVVLESLTLIIPEPRTAGLLAIGVAGLAWRRRPRRVSRHVSRKVSRVGGSLRL